MNANDFLLRVAGGVAAVITSPLEVIKTRLQVRYHAVISLSFTVRFSFTALYL